MNQERLTDLEAAVAVRDRKLGPDHPDTLSARHDLAMAYFYAGIGNGEARLPDAIGTLERVAEGRVSALGTAHPDTLATWASLALLYARARRHEEVPALHQRIAAGWEEVVAERERRLGPDEPETQFARIRLAFAYGDVGRKQDKVTLLEHVIASWGRLAVERERRLGPMHPDTVDAREHHAYCHRWVGRTDEEVSLVEQIATDHQRLLGPTHPRTLHAQVELAARYCEGGHDLAQSTALGERIIGDVRALLGAEHDDLRTLRAVMIGGYAMTGRTNDALALAARYPLPDDPAPE